MPLAFIYALHTHGSAAITRLTCAYRRASAVHVGSSVAMPIYVLVFKVVEGEEWIKLGWAANVGQRLVDSL